jgi:hypothetical protein
MNVLRAESIRLLFHWQDGGQRLMEGGLER